jgi:hypothetical protein
MRELLDILRAEDWRELVVDVIGLVALVVALYALTVVAAAFLP